jgi:hypothetical protein
MARVALAGVLIIFTGHASAADTNSPSAYLAAEFKRIQLEFKMDTNNAETAWKLGRSCYDMSSLQKDSAIEARYAEEGIAACRASLAQNSNSVAAHYYLGMDIGQLADTKRNLSALWMVKDMEREFAIARLLDVHFDFAGPDRNLGLLYRDAPAIASIGSRSKARQHLEESVKLAPEFPENQLNLIESYLKWDYKTEAQRQYAAMMKIWPGAQENFTGIAWQLSWEDWNKRLETVNKKLGQNPKAIAPHSQ